MSPGANSARAASEAGARSPAAKGGPADGVTVRLLGALEAEVRGLLVPPPAHPLGPLLLAWLALHPGDHPRGELAALLSPGIAESSARTALRRAAWAVRRALGPCERELRDGRTTIGLRCATDLQEFEMRLAAGDVAAALALCRGALLDGLGEHAWVLAARERHAVRVAAARAQLAHG